MSLLLAFVSDLALKLCRFLHSMDLAYAAADLIVSRAGAMTCCEILATGKPSILVLTCILTVYISTSIRLQY